MNYLDLTKNGFRLYQTALTRGYISRKKKDSDLVCDEYTGKYGKGYKVLKPNFNSTKYCVVEYWIK